MPSYPRHMLPYFEALQKDVGVTQLLRMSQEVH